MRMFSFFSWVRRRTNKPARKLTIGVLKLSAEIVHVIVPSRQPAAYLNAKVRDNESRRQSLNEGFELDAELADIPFRLLGK